MKRFLCFYGFFSFLWSFNLAMAEGLPANPWQSPQRLNTLPQEEPADFSSQAVSAAENFIDKVRESEEFQRLTAAQSSNETKDSSSDLRNQLEMIEKLAKLSSASQNQSGLLKQDIKKQTQELSNSYEKSLRQLKIKYRNAKNRSLNAIDDSYRRTLRSIKNSTGVDVERTVNDSLNALK